MKVKFVKRGEHIEFRVAEAFMVNGYRILVNRDNQKGTTAWIGDDGESDRIYESEEKAESAVIAYCNKLIKCNLIEVYEVTK